MQAFFFPAFLMPHVFYLAAALLLGAGATAAQTTTAPTPAAAPDWSVPYAATIAPAGLRADLSVLASDAYEGRETGQKGQRMAAAYLAKAFAADGLRGPVPGAENPYLQHFALRRTALDIPASTLTIGSQVYRGQADFYPLLSQPLRTPLQPVFVGYGIREGAYDDVQPAGRTQGKDVVLLAGEPRNARGQSLLTPDGQPSAYAAPGMAGLLARGAALGATGMRSLIIILPTEAAFRRVPVEFKDDLGQAQLAPADAAPGPDLPILFVSAAVGARLLGTTPAGLAAYQQAVAQAGHAIASPFRPVPATVQAKLTTSTIGTENVLGYLEGSDKKDEVLVLSAHYDHLGIKNGVVFNGADDDGSGTVSVLAMARAFTQAKKDGHGPRRSILFLANTGEEEGLLGSEYYTSHPVFPLASTVTDLNIDMVGRLDSLHAGRPDYVYLVGDDKLSSELHALSEATNQQYQPLALALDYKYNDPADPEHIYERSDHYNFAKHGIPVIFYTSGLHKDYHAATDDVDKINFEALARRAQLVFHTAWALANREQRVVVDSHKE